MSEFSHSSKVEAKIVNIRRHIKDYNLESAFKLCESRDICNFEVVKALKAQTLFLMHHNEEAAILGREILVWKNYFISSNK